MPDRLQTERKMRALSASSILEAIGEDLSQIKREDRLTYADLARVLGKSEDQAAKYCEATQEMGAVAFAFAWDQWNGRFTGRLAALINGKPDSTNDRAKESAILKAALALSLALDDEEVDNDEIRKNRVTLENAREAIDGLLSRLGPKAGVK